MTVRRVVQRTAGRRAARASRWAQLATLGAASCLLLTACGGSTLNAREVALANQEALGLTPASGAAADPVGEPTPGTGGVPGTAHQPVGTVDPTGGATRDVSAPGGTPVEDRGSGAGSPPATGGAKAGSCAGFRNQTGIDDSTITLANVADTSGPVPGIFTSAQLATKAYVQYFNATSTICGRKLAVLPLDSRTDAGGDNTAWQKACEKAFMGVGSMSAFDSGGAATTQRCGIPDLRAVQTNEARTSCTTCFATESSGNGLYNTAAPVYWLRHHHGQTQNAAMMYVNEAASVSNAEDEVRAQTRLGWKFVYTAKFDVAEFNFAPYAQAMKKKGVQLVQFFGATTMAVSLAQAFAQADFHPQLWVNSAIYDQTYAGAGSPVDGTIVFIDFLPLEDVARSPEMQLYQRWLQQVSPGARMTYFGLFAWSAARLAVQQMTRLGGRLSRPAMNAALRSVHAWTANGLHPAMDVGGKRPATCWRFVQLHGGRWHDYGGGYTCGPTVRSH